MRAGRKIEVTEISLNEDEVIKENTYYTTIYDVISEDKLQIAMPVEKGRLILLQVDTEYEIVVHGDDNLLFQCVIIVTDRYKMDNVHIVVAEMTSNLRRYQRREFYRYSCVLDMETRTIEEDEKAVLAGHEHYIIKKELPLKKSAIVDISGGGVRFIMAGKFELNSTVYCTYNILVKDEIRSFELVGKILDVNKIETKPGSYLYRLQFVDIDTEDRESIIKYIFQEERKNRKSFNDYKMGEE